jgi:hypothetical protein
MDNNVWLGEAERIREHGANVEGVLGAGPDLEPRRAIRAELGHGAARLDSSVGGHGHVDAQVHVPGRLSGAEAPLRENAVLE